MKQMTVQEVLEYVVKFDGMKFGKDEKRKGDDICGKLVKLIEKAGFVFYTFSCGSILHYKLREENSHNYTEIRIALREEKKSYGYGRNEKRATIGYYGFVEVNEVKVSLNPQTGQPWQIGDIDYSQPLRPMWTSRGWSTGD